MESQSTFLQRNQCKSQSRLFDQFYCNLRFHKGSDVQTVWRLSVAMQFQSTLPRRERLNNCLIVSYCIRFQSTLPRRERQNSGVPRSIDNVFQSTLPRRERQNPSHTAQHHQHISIHAPTKGATQATQNAIGYVQFQSTLPRRERRSGFETK